MSEWEELVNGTRNRAMATGSASGEGAEPEFAPLRGARPLLTPTTAKPRSHPVDLGESGGLGRSAAQRGQATVPVMAQSRSGRRPRSPKGRATVVHERLAELYPEALCELNHSSPFQLLIATILSAQCTDVKVNTVTPELFGRWATPESLMAANPEELEAVIRPTGFFRSKAKNLIGMATSLVELHGSEVPGDMAQLVALPGVGRKTANVVRSVALGLPGLPVDTHVLRLSQRLDLTSETDPIKVELVLNPMIPADERGKFSLRLILHGRRVCGARRPDCGACTLNDFCPSAQVGA